MGSAAGLLTWGSLPRRLPDLSASGFVAEERLPSQRRDRPGFAPGSLTVLLIAAKPTRWPSVLHRFEAMTGFTQPDRSGPGRATGLTLARSAGGGGGHACSSSIRSVREGNHPTGRGGKSEPRKPRGGAGGAKPSPTFTQRRPAINDRPNPYKHATGHPAHYAGDVGRHGQPNQPFPGEGDLRTDRRTPLPVDAHRSANPRREGQPGVIHGRARRRRSRCNPGERA
jgi:hypothetical protein